MTRSTRSVRENLAHGASRGIRWIKSIQSPGGAKESVENEAFVKRNALFSEEREEFVAERHFLMMFVLVTDVSRDTAYSRGAYGEGAVSGLPCEGAAFRPFVVDPP